MKAIVSIKDVVNEMDVLSDEHSAFLNRHTGELVTLSSEELSAAEENDNIDEYPEWQQDIIIKAKEVINSDDYLPLPSKFDIHEYHMNGIEEDWYCFRQKELEKIAIDWLEVNQISYTKDNS